MPSFQLVLEGPDEPAAALQDVDGGDGSAPTASRRIRHGRNSRQSERLCAPVGPAAQDVLEASLSRARR
jgi:hypothetical protein